MNNLIKLFDFLFDGRARKLRKLYFDEELYSSRDMFSPPSERLNHVIRFELTTGCDYGRCTYCGGFDGVKFSVKNQEGYRAHVNSIWEGMNPDLKKGFRRIFIGGGNALQVAKGNLESAIKFTVERFAQEVGLYPKRLSMYGRTKSIIEKGRVGLSDLHYSYRESNGFHRGLDLIYWGIETGSTNLLEWINKGCTEEDLMKAANEVQSGVVETSVMVMPGLGGMRFYDDHVEKTGDVLNKIQPNYITFMGVNARRGTIYDRRIQEETSMGINRPLTDYELARQMIEIIGRLKPKNKVKIGCYPTCIDAVGHNPFTFGSENLYVPGHAPGFAQALTYRLEKHDRYKRLRNRHRRLMESSKID